MLSLTRIFFYINLLVLVNFAVGRTVQTPIYDSQEETMVSPAEQLASIKDMPPTRVDGAPSTPNLDKSATIDQLRQALKQQSERASAVEERLSILSEKQDLLLARNKETSDENIRLKGENQALEKSLDAAKMNDQAADALSALQQEHQKQLEEHTAQAARLAELQQRFDAQAKELAQKEAELSRKPTEDSEELDILHKALSKERAILKENASKLAQNQWLALEDQIVIGLKTPTAVCEDAADSLQRITNSVDTQISGQRASWAMLAALRKDKTALEKQLAELKDVAATVAALQKAAGDAQAIAKTNADDVVLKSTQIASLQDKIALQEKEIAQLKIMLEKLESSDSAPAHLLKAQLLSLQHFVEANLDKLMQQLTKAGLGLNSLAQRIEESREFTNNTDAIARALKTLGEDLEEYFKQITETLKNSGKNQAAEKPQNNQAIEDLKEKYALMAAQFNEQILALQKALQAQREAQTPGTNSEIAQLRAELQAQKDLDRRFADAEQARLLGELKNRQDEGRIETLKDASTQSAIAGANRRATEARITATNTRVTDLAISATNGALAQTSALQGNITAGTALGASIAQNRSAQQGSTSVPISNPTTISIGQQPLGQQPLSQFVSGMPLQQGSMMSKAQMMNGLPIQGQQMVGNLMGMPQFQAPGSMQQAQYTLAMIVQNNSKYRQFYNQAIQMILQPTISVATRDRIETALQQAIKLEGYYLYQFGQNGSQQSRQQAISLIQGLINDVQRPLVDLQQRLQAQGLGLVPPPSETIAVLNGYLSNLASIGGSPARTTY